MLILPSRRFRTSQQRGMDGVCGAGRGTRRSESWKVCVGTWPGLGGRKPASNTCRLNWPFGGEHMATGGDRAGGPHKWSLQEATGLSTHAHTLVKAHTEFPRFLEG